MAKEKQVTCLSLGAGIQSTTLFLMSCDGVLPKLDCAIFADTQWEPKEVYENLEWLKVRGEASGIPIHEVSNGSLREAAIGMGTAEKRIASMPLYVLGDSGENGMLRRQCTREFKVEVIDKFIKRELFGLKPGERATGCRIEQWMGISTDEIRRAKMSRDYWRIMIYPLLGLPEKMLPTPLSRAGCVEWLSGRYPKRSFPRSACIGCPFRSNSSWQQIKRDPEAWQDAIEVDESIRKLSRIDREAFLHRSCKPLSEANLDDDQGMLWDDACDSGYCGL